MPSGPTGHGWRLSGFVLASLAAHAALLLYGLSSIRLPTLAPHPGAAPVIAARLLTHRPAPRSEPTPRPTSTPPAAHKPAAHHAPAHRASPRHRIRHADAAHRSRPAPASDAPAKTRERHDQRSPPAPRGASPGERASPAAHSPGRAPPRPAIRGAAVRARLEHALRAHFYYPYVARRNGWQGETDLGLHISADGRISGVHVVKSSGHRMLDRAAVKSARRIKVLPELVDLLYGRALNLVLPVRYRLYDG